jgi:ABC-type cobalamin/Fe3+-siderophores transport system ATPase subunit
MRNRLVYLVGPPGAGKTTVLDRLVGSNRRVLVRKPFAHQLLPDIGAVILGEHRPPFSGTDTLSMGVARIIEPWLQRAEHPLILAEGDRLAYERFFRVAAQAGYEVRLFHIDVDQVTAERRRRVRSEMNGLKAQNEAWCAGRATKARNLAYKLEGEFLSGACTVDELVGRLREVIWT